MTNKDKIQIDGAIFQAHGIRYQISNSLNIIAIVDITGRQKQYVGNVDKITDESFNVYYNGIVKTCREEIFYDQIEFINV